MADLYIDGDVLRRTELAFSQIEQLLDPPARAMREVDGNRVGPDELEREVRSFADDWGYGIEQLGQFAGGAVEAIRSIVAAFDEADQALAQALEQSSARGASTTGSVPR